MQLEFFWRDATSLRHELEQHVGSPIRLALTDNTSTLLTVDHEPRGDGIRLRLHQMFLSASPKVLRALATWVKHPKVRPSAAVLDEFIRQNSHHIRRTPPRPQRLRIAGRVHDIKAMYDELNHEYFGGAVEARITWGRMPTRKRRRSIRFGSYEEGVHLIRIHPLLDQDFVPGYFVRYIMFHEMLHASLGIQASESGRRRIHTAEFKQREKAYPDYARALAWQDNPSSLARILRKAS